jgi:CRISPR-associated endoribonuclease Cas6
MKLYSSVICLLNLHHVTLAHLGGQHAHAAFLDILRQVDPELSQKLHDTRGKGARQPFTVSPLMGLPKGSGVRSYQTSGVQSRRWDSPDSEIYLREGWECWQRVTILDDTLFKTFIDYFMSASQRKLPEIRLGDGHFLVREILTTPGSHPWAGYIGLEELQKRLDDPAPQRFCFEFHSPTSFKLQDKQVATLPTARLVFGSLATAWKALTGEDHVRAVETYAEQNLDIGAYHLRRERLILHNNPQLGAVGTVEFINSDKADHPTARALNLLADLAFYTGLGRKTAQGMGMVSRVVC